MGLTFNTKNINSLAPKWFRRLKKSITLLADTTAVILLAMGYTENTLIMLIVRIGVSGVLESVEALLSDSPEVIADPASNVNYNNKP